LGDVRSSTRASAPAPESWRALRVPSVRRRRQRPRGNCGRQARRARLVDGGAGTVVAAEHASGEAERRRARVPSAAAAANVHASERPRAIECEEEPSAAANPVGGAPPSAGRRFPRPELSTRTRRGGCARLSSEGFAG
jgi:hypothetical protein